MLPTSARMQSSLSAAAQRLAKGHFSTRASASSGPVPPSVLSPLPVPEAHAGLLLRPFGGPPRGRFISSTATLSSNSNSKPEAPRAANNPATGGASSNSNSKPEAPGAANNPATGGASSAPVPPLHLMSFGGPQGSKLRDSEEFLQQNEVLQTLPRDRRILPVSGHTHLFPDLGRELFRSALLIPFVSHLRKCTSEGVFEGNVGVIEELNAFGLKEVFPYQVDDLTDDMMPKNF
ncbi:hypothetical protein SETIT_2G425300v2 [Setaria italica]|uniref:Uncharacterized protein n=1 Tax=Setaria italica TaxID=4555 RepID=A0A368Q8T7_SETIT|nr:hypothetical protein SETIT_2G425300v2 [Setaria italica]